MNRFLDALKRLIRQSRLYGFVEYVQQRQELRKWIKRGRTGPAPHLVKQAAIRQYASKFGLRTLIESGTCLGAMVNAMKDRFERIVSIELDTTLYKRAQRLFAHYGHVTFINGDSATVLPRVLENISESSLFWLDAHYSGGITAKGNFETPIVQELEHILNHDVVGHVILVDDAGQFNGTHDYPTIDQLKALVHASRPGWLVNVQDDIIRIHAPATKGEQQAVAAVGSISILTS